jgi:2-oxoglutarate dehydrogenase E2 component (dihydrolipoamide succinyltransferase)
MGESIAEGTVARWLKRVGEEVARDEPLLEISTDKVDAEIPSPAAGTLADIAVQEGQTVEVGTVVAWIETEKGATKAPAAAPAPSAEPKAAARPAPAAAAAAAPAPVTAATRAAQSASSAAAPTESQGDGADGRAESAEERLRRRSTPLVRRIAAEHDVDLTEVPGTGHAGRVTKHDILSFLEQREPAAPRPAAAPTPAPPRPAVAAPAGAEDFWNIFYGQVRHPEYPVRPADRVQPMDRIRKLTADHMVRAKRVAPHVHSFIEVDFTQIDRVRNQWKAQWEQQGARVSYTAFVAWACARVLREFPMVNGTVSGDNLVFRGEIHVGIAVDLNPGLIVPVVRSADELNLLGLARRINDLAQRAREKKLKPDEIQGATFSITNPGVLGTIVGMPIIPEGTAAILGTGAIEKRAVVIEAEGTDVIAIRKRAFFSLGYDHRIVDGADAARFLSRLKQTLEGFPSDVA